MPDPYERFVRESKVSSSQEYILQRIPGWEDKGEAALSPSQAPLPLSRLCGASSSSSSSDDEDTAEERAPAFSLQRPLELASPDTQACQEDSYNPAFESDRERSLSPHAGCNVYSSLWASRLITQSQDVVGGMSHLAQIDMYEVQGIASKSERDAGLVHEFVPLKNQNDVLVEQSNPDNQNSVLPFKIQNNVLVEQSNPNNQDNVLVERSNSYIVSNKLQKLSHQERVHEEYGQAIVSESAAFEEMEGHVRKISAQTVMPTKKHNGVECEKSIHRIDSGDRLFSSVDPIQVRGTNQLTSASDQAFQERSGGVSSSGGHAVHPSPLDSREPQQSSAVTARVGSSHNAENLIKWKDKGGDRVLDISSQKRKFLKHTGHAQENRNLPTYTEQSGTKESKAPSVIFSQERRQTAGSTATKCGLPLEESTEVHTLEVRITSVTDNNPEMDSADCLAFPKSIMDVVILASGELPTPRDEDLDFLSVFMSKGVSLPLAFRDCKGHLVPAPRIDNT